MILEYPKFVDEGTPDMPSPDEKLNELRQRLGKVTEDVNRIQTTLSDIENDLRWHGRVGWRLAAVYAAVFVSVMAGLVSWYIPHEIDSRIPANFAQDFGRMQQKLEDIDQRLNTLTPTSLKELIPPPDRSLRPEEIADRLTRAAKLMNVAMTLKIPGNPRELAPLNQRIVDIRHRYSTDPKLQPVVDGAAVNLSAYELVSKFLLDGGEPTPPDSPKPMSTRPLFTIGHDSTLLCSQPFRGTSAFGFASAQKAEATVFLELKFKNCPQKLDGPRWVGVEFISSRIVYNGGPLYLSDTRFTDCDLVFGNDPRSQRVKHIIDKSKGKPVSLFLPNPS